jgi:hypothetical protein
MTNVVDLTPALKSKVLTEASAMADEMKRRDETLLREIARLLWAAGFPRAETETILAAIIESMERQTAAAIEQSMAVFENEGPAGLRRRLDQKR